MINSWCLLGSLASCLQIQCSSLMTHSEFYHNSTPSASVSNWCGFCYTSCKTYSEYSLLKDILSHLSHHEAFYVLYTFSITFQWSMSIIFRYAKISQLQVMSQDESYLSILKLQTAEALGTYSIWSISHSFMGPCLFSI